MKYKYFIETNEDGSIIEHTSNSIVWRTNDKEIEIYLAKWFIVDPPNSSRLYGFLYEEGYEESLFEEATEEMIFAEMI